MHGATHALHISGDPKIDGIKHEAYNTADIDISNLKTGTNIWSVYQISNADETAIEYQAANYRWEYSYNPATAIVARMILGNDLNIQFAIPEDLALVSITDGESAVVYESMGKVTEDPYKGYTIYQCYVKSNEMTKEFKITVEKDGKTYTKTESVQKYAMRLLGNTADPEVQALLVDMLNYGAMAQAYFDGTEDGLANAELDTDRQDAFVNVKDLFEGVEPADGTANLVLNDRLDIQIRVDAKYDGETLKYTFKPFDGDELTFNAPVIEGEDDEGNPIFFVRANQIVFADYASMITVKDSEGETVASDSVLHYVLRRIGKEQNDADLQRALLKFAMSAEAYLA